MNDFELVVGLEVHVQLKTRTKIFCACSTNFGDPPNTNVCPVCLGLPGALPVLNDHAVALAIRAALALGCRVNGRSVFARKNYFYPDLPKGYQISQFDHPLASQGRVFGVGIQRVHLEEDAGRSLHDRFPGMSAVDLNRAGVPLIEIVTEPDIRSASEAGGFVQALRQLLEYMRVSDVNMEEGSLRVDANVSIRPRGETRLGQKTEVKNLNSFSALERAIEVEFLRQAALVDGGGGRGVEQQTMLWDAAVRQVRPARAKEGSEDYRYFPDPDLPPLVLSRTRISRVLEHLPELPTTRRRRFRADYGLSDHDIDVLTASAPLADYYEAVARQHGDAKAAANWVMGEVLAALKGTDGDIDVFRVRPADLATLLNLVRDGIVTRTAGKQIFSRMVIGGGAPADIATREGLLRISDDDTLHRWLEEALDELPDETRRYAAGERKLQGVLIGAAMRKSRGSADPRRLAQLLAERFGM
jgi:aspartyl-tRNA(Asn)/glutamyl-tRNA(Gln) amidotransferase subunit B